MKGTPELTLSELPAIETLKKLGFKESKQKEILNEDLLLKSLEKINKGIAKDILYQAINDLKKEISPSYDRLFEANKKIYFYLKKGAFIKSFKNTINVKFIDFENIENNNFEYSQQQNLNGIIPDILIYVNGMPLSIIEAKSPTLMSPMKEGVKQLKSYERKNPKLFNFIQMETVIAMTNAIYSTTLAPEDKFSPGEEVEGETKQETLLKMLYRKDNFLEIIKDFILHTTKAKIIARYIQFRATNKAINTLKNKEDGIIFHSQGSGKSYTMVYIANKILSTFEKPTIIVITDRVDLDKQIGDTFSQTQSDLKIEQASNKKSLKEFLKNDYKKIILTTIHKFEEDIEPIYMENVFILSDEAHRSVYSSMGMLVRKILPNAKYMAFTGTPIDKTEKTFNKVIDRYTMKESVRDQLTLPISYQARYATLSNIDKDSIRRFSKVLESKEKKAMTKLDLAYKSWDRVLKIVLDMVSHYQEKIEPEGFKAMFVAEDRESAIRVKEALDQLQNEGIHNIESRVVFSLDHNDPEEYHEIAGTKEGMKETYLSFKKKNDPVKILIVSDMLLTGYDNPLIKVLYLDKNLQGHTLFQAITRVNRVHENKGFGLIVDYRGIAKALNETIKHYNSDEFILSNVNELQDKFFALKEELFNLIPLSKERLTFENILNYFSVNPEKRKAASKIFTDIQETLIPITKLIEPKEMIFYSVFKKVFMALREEHPEEFISGERLSLMQGFLDTALTFAIEDLGVFSLDHENKEEIIIDYNEDNNKNSFNSKKTQEQDYDVFIAEELELKLLEKELSSKESVYSMNKECSLSEIFIKIGLEKNISDKYESLLSRDYLEVKENFDLFKGEVYRELIKSFKSKVLAEEQRDKIIEIVEKRFL